MGLSSTAALRKGAPELFLYLAKWAGLFTKWIQGLKHIQKIH